MASSIKSALEIGTMIGLITAIGSFIGVIGGGYFGDKLREKYSGASIWYYETPGLYEWMKMLKVLKEILN